MLINVNRCLNMLIDCKRMLLGVRKDVKDVDSSWTTCNNILLHMC